MSDRLDWQSTSSLGIVPSEDVDPEAQPSGAWQSGAWLDTMFRNPRYNEFSQQIIAFCLGVLFSPWSWGFIYYLAFLILYEIVTAYMTWCQPPYWCLSSRIGIVAASLLGFIVGRIIVGYEHPLKDEAPNTSLKKK